MMSETMLRVFGKSLFAAFIYVLCLPMLLLWAALAWVTTAFRDLLREGE